MIIFIVFLCTKRILHQLLCLNDLYNWDPEATEAFLTFFFGFLTSSELAKPIQCKHIQLLQYIKAMNSASYIKIIRFKFNHTLPLLATSI